MNCVRCQGNSARVDPCRGCCRVYGTNWLVTPLCCGVSAGGATHTICIASSISAKAYLMRTADPGCLFASHTSCNRPSCCSSRRPAALLLPPPPPPPLPVASPETMTSAASSSGCRSARRGCEGARRSQSPAVVLRVSRPHEFRKASPSPLNSRLCGMGARFTAYKAPGTQRGGAVPPLYQSNIWGISQDVWAHDLAQGWSSCGMPGSCGSRAAAKPV